uniref:Integrase zinc-binding domain-containing protein n=1 Tax=Chromera velia CCMP2878 TaxID=1169474 RepID=A0A0G4I701_9ALVE|eukprot:Cvel_36471.t1-p1 / transcript=Cvel_36471.t1 / gene=Cvel_36471 / organism=Chromera_velia_CCMP2878 / gene_product=hypothetical protein / transcript_product=hypothetical protein / location=Cvel_scaffold7302:738-1154(-) / protein_length=139 / sequence_SO=supercontig / SO=protein_coding / is_pseudo=false
MRGLTPPKGWQGLLNASPILQVFREIPLQRLLKTRTHRRETQDGCDHLRQIDGDAIDSGRVSTRAGVPQRLRRKERMRLGDVAMRELVEQAHHQTGHIGGAALRRMLSRHFTNPKLPSLCREVIEQCEECAQVKGASHR